MNIQYADLHEVLETVFTFSWDKHPEFDSRLKKFYDRKDTRITNIISDKFQITAKVGHTWEYPDRKYEMVHYVSDRKIIKDPEPMVKCDHPLHFMPNSNYYYYGCYMTICAYLLEKVPDRMLIYCGPDDNTPYVFKYREEIAKIILARRYHSLEMLRSRQENRNQSKIFS